MWGGDKNGAAGGLARSIETHGGRGFEGGGAAQDSAGGLARNVQDRAILAGAGAVNGWGLAWL